jgi:hypothetical protein
MQTRAKPKTNYSYIHYETAQGTSGHSGDICPADADLLPSASQPSSSTVDPAPHAVRVDGAFGTLSLCPFHRTMHHAMYAPLYMAGSSARASSSSEMPRAANASSSAIASLHNRCRSPTSSCGPMHQGIVHKKEYVHACP